jgi:hypothetical protein
MKPNRIILLLAVCLSVIIYSCKKDSDSNSVTPIKPDLSIKKITTVTGFVTDENNAPLAGVQVKAGDKENTTDEYGYFAINEVSLPEVAGFVKAVKTGYFDNYRTFTANEEHATFVRVKMLPKKEAGVVEATAGGSVTSTDWVKITLPANAVVVADGGAAYTGQVHINVQKIDPTNAGELITLLPGDGRATDKDGYLKLLKAYTGIAIELTGNSGQRLQVAPGKQAAISMPIPASVYALAPASIALWSLDESKGLWKQEGEAIKTANAYEATVSHFSFWSGAVGYPLVNFAARVVNTTAQPLANVPVIITVANQPVNAGYSQFAWTDANGYVNGAVLANTSLVASVLTPCNISAYSHSFATTNIDVDLGSITGNLGQSTVTISGTATDCNNAPVTNGYIQTYDNGFYNRINIVNGNFSFTGLACTNTVVHVVAVNKAANQQNTPQELTLTAGLNNLGALTACGTSTLGSISYAVNGGAAHLMVEPTDTLGGYFFTGAGGVTTIATLSGAKNGTPIMSFQITGPAETGGSHKVTEVFSDPFPGGRLYAPVPLNVTITEYGKPGGFIGGSFSGLMLGFSDNSIQNISCSFRIRCMN